VRREIFASLWVERLKFPTRTSDAGNVIFERLAIDSGADTYRLDFHEHLTVIADVGQLEREGLVNELIGALGASRAGVHLEMASDAGNRFAVFRPDGARHRVVAIDTAEDVSDRFRGPDGTIDLLARAGLDPRSAKRTMRVGPHDLHTTSQEERYLEALARIEQGRLWDLADKVTEREASLESEAEATGSAPEDVDIVSRIDELHRTAEQAEERHEEVRGWTMWLSFGAALTALPVAVALGGTVALPLLITAMVAAGISLWHYHQVGLARRAEQEALSEAGANNYLNFHLNRVNKLLSSDQGRQRLMSAAEAHRAALAQWRLIAGDIPVAWAIEHRDAIREAAREHQATRNVGRVTCSTPEVISEVSRDIRTALRARLSELQAIGPGGESFPTILDEPFENIPPEARPDLLAALAQAARHQQVILLTAQPDIAAWARAEATTGAVSLIEPPAAEDVSPPHPHQRTPLRPHVAA
jgi:hypothetical protein